MGLRHPVSQTCASMLQFDLCVQVHICVHILTDLYVCIYSQISCVGTLSHTQDFVERSHTDVLKDLTHVCQTCASRMCEKERSFSHMCERDPFWKISCVGTLSHTRDFFERSHTDVLKDLAHVCQTCASRMCEKERSYSHMCERDPFWKISCVRILSHTRDFFERSHTDVLKDLAHVCQTCASRMCEKERSFSHMCERDPFWKISCVRILSHTRDFFERSHTDFWKDLTQIFWKISHMCLWHVRAKYVRKRNLSHTCVWEREIFFERSLAWYLFLIFLEYFFERSHTDFLARSRTGVLKDLAHVSQTRACKMYEKETSFSHMCLRKRNLSHTCERDLSHIESGIWSTGGEDVIDALSL